MLDLDAYLRRIRYAGPRASTLDVLEAVCARQPDHIPFENLDPFLGRPPQLALAAVQDKLVARRRGGYCFELNLLLAEALEALGMQVTRLAARVMWNQPSDAPIRWRSHMLLKVSLPCAGGDWLADAGFGGRLLGAPLRFDPGPAQPRPTGAERIVREGEDFIVQVQTPAGWSPVYRFDLVRFLPVDYEPLNWFTATRPQSLFANNLLLERLTPVLRANLLNDMLVTQAPGEAPVRRRLADAGEFAGVVEELFGLEPPVPASEVWQRVPKGLDGAWMPPAPPP